MDALRLDRLVPVLCAARLRPLHECRKFDRTATAQQAIVALAAERKFHGLAEALLPRPGRDRGIADEEGAERALIDSISAAAVSSTAKPRWRFDAIASTAAISPTVKRRKSIS
jgi:hypothetical protein